MTTDTIDHSTAMLSQFVMRGTSILLHGSVQSTIESVIQRYIHQSRSIAIDFNLSELIQEPNLDIIILNTPESTIKIDQIKSIQHRVSHGASQPLPCIVIIAQANKMTTQASNALLKILEEPPKNTVFLLTSCNKHGLLPTILSRTLHLFCPSSHDAILSELSTLPKPIISSKELIRMDHLTQVITIQSLPSKSQELSDTIYFWLYELVSDLCVLTKKECLFLEKMIDIIQDLKYNLNLKLQIMNAIIELSKED